MAIGPLKPHKLSGEILKILPWARIINTAIAPTAKTVENNPLFKPFIHSSSSIASAP